MEKIKFKCLLCGRDNFDAKQPHRCQGGFRKRGLKWEIVNLNNQNHNNMKNQMDSSYKFLLGVYIAIGCLIWLWIGTLCTKNHYQPTPIIHNQIPVGYNLGKVGKDSVLTIKGQFVRQVGDRVMIKVK
jgi:hypothetical protein